MSLSYILMKKMGNRMLGDPFGQRSGYQFSPSGTYQVEEQSIDFSTEQLDKSDLSELSRDPSIIGVIPAIPLKLVNPVETIEPFNTAEPSTWGVDAVGASGSQYTGKGVKVAVLDTGIDPNHPAFNGVNLIRKNFTSEGDDDNHGHGTHVAGTIFGRSVEGKRIGVAPGIETAIIGKVLGNGGGSSSDILKAIRWAADQGATIISMSLGMDFPGYSKQLIDKGYPEDLAVSLALEGYRANVTLFSSIARLLQAEHHFGSGAVLVAAGGNESRREAGVNYELTIAPPSSAEGVLSVGALGKLPAGLRIGDFSNTGVDLSAPGINVLSARLGGGLVGLTGTSMATPHVAGVMALWAEKLMSEGPLNLNELLARVRGTANKAPLAAGYDGRDVGAGIVQAP